MPFSRAKPPRKSQAHDTSTVHAGTSNVPLPLSAQEQPAGTAHAGAPNAPLPSDHQQQATTVPADKLSPAYHADRTGHSPTPSPRRLCFPCRASPGLMVESIPAVCAQVESWHSPQERHADHPGSLWLQLFSKRSRATHLGELLHPHGRQRPRHPAQQRHVRVSFCCLLHLTSTSKDTWGFAALVAGGLLRRPSIVDSPTVTFCSAHLHQQSRQET